MREKQVRKLPPWTTCPDCASTVRPFRGLEEKNGRARKALFECDCGRSRWTIEQRLEDTK